MTDELKRDRASDDLSIEPCPECGSREKVQAGDPRIHECAKCYFAWKSPDQACADAASRLEQQEPRKWSEQDHSWEYDLQSATPIEQAVELPPLKYLLPEQYISWCKKVDDPDYYDHRYVRDDSKQRAMISAIRELRDTRNHLQAALTELAQLKGQKR